MIVDEKIIELANSHPTVFFLQAYKGWKRFLDSRHYPAVIQEIDMRAVVMMDTAARCIKIKKNRLGLNEGKEDFFIDIIKDFC